MAMWSPSDSPTFENPLEYLHVFKSEYNVEQLMHTSKGSLFEGPKNSTGLFDYGGIDIENSTLASTSSISDVSTLSSGSSDPMVQYLRNSSSPDFASTVTTCSPADTLENVSGESAGVNEEPYNWPVIHPASPVVPASAVAARKRKRVNEDETPPHRYVASHHCATKQRVSYKESDSKDLDNDDIPEYQDECNLKTYGPKLLNRKRPSSKEYPCPHPNCPKIFSRLYDAQRYDNAAHGNKKYICTSCDAASSRADALLRHKTSKRCSRQFRAVEDKTES
ncbi:hypothetical protein J3R30DRAFT_921718 [Lentinula aciculospora]|uniref:C2H2-type domain-containing protein n=1 Tax=Lentinula aciculospora TaxID=153920 RepID=A0A9W9AQM1_9AGAR|nr:hypothetical protein J3R30DRAFT_921718 [Lentinula aciculospora]